MRLINNPFQNIPILFYVFLFYAYQKLKHVDFYRYKKIIFDLIKNKISKIKNRQ